MERPKRKISNDLVIDQFLLDIKGNGFAVSGAKFVISEDERVFFLHL